MNLQSAMCSIRDSNDIKWGQVFYQGTASFAQYIMFFGSTVCSPLGKDN